MSSGAPSISAITVAGSRLAYSSTTSTNGPFAAIASSSSVAISSVRVRSPATAFALNARLTSLR